MTLTRPFGIDAGFPNAIDVRKALGGLLPREGVFPDPVTTAAAGIAFAGTGWGVSARAFVAAVKRGGSAFESAYGTAFIANDGTASNVWTIPAAPGSGSRYDVLCIRARDSTQGDPTAGAPTDGPGGAARTGLPEWLVVSGTAATTPTVPSIPAGYLEVGRMLTPSGAASAAGSTFIKAYKFAQVSGDVTYVWTTAEITGLAAVPGALAVALDTGFTWRYNGTRWGRYGQKIAGVEGSYMPTGGIIAPGTGADIVSLTLPNPLMKGGMIRFAVAPYLWFPTAGNYGGSIDLFVNNVSVASRGWHNQARSGAGYPSVVFEYRVPTDIASAVDARIRVNNIGGSAGGIEIFLVNASIVYDYLAE